MIVFRATEVHGGTSLVRQKSIYFCPLSDKSPLNLVPHATKVHLGQSRATKVHVDSSFFSSILSY